MSDTYSPLLMRINPDGTVTAEFEGHVIAEGLDLEAALAAVGTLNKIRWLKKPEDAEVAFLGAYYTAANESAMVIQVLDALGGGAFLSLLADEIRLQTPGTGITRVINDLEVTGGDVTIPGGSLHIGLGGDSINEIAMGTTTVTGNGTASQTRTLSHSLSSTPIVAFAICDNKALNCSIDAKTASQLTIGFRHVDNAVWSSTNGLYWIAIR